MCLFLLRTQTNMSNVIAGNRGGRGGAAITAITVALILILMASPVILMTTTQEAFAAPISNKDCKDIQFRPFGNAFASYSDKTVTIGTSQQEYSVKTDYLKIEDDIFEYLYYKNEGADDPQGRVLLPGDETITITLQTQQGLSHAGVMLFYTSTKYLIAKSF